MISRAQWKVIAESHPMRLALFSLGVLLMLVTPAVAIIPGPGGIFVFAAGLALALRNSDWAKRRYVQFKRWQPRAGAWADWGLRRRSARRRDAQRKAKEREDQPPPHCIERTDDPLPSSGFEFMSVDPTPGELRPGAAREFEQGRGERSN